MLDVKKRNVRVNEYRKKLGRNSLLFVFCLELKFRKNKVMKVHRVFGQKFGNVVSGSVHFYIIMYMLLKHSHGISSFAKTEK